MLAVPADFHAYAPVVARFDAVRPVGGGLTCRCPLPDRHKNGDANPSCRLWIGERRELVGRCLACGATWGELVHAIGLPACAWWPQPLERRRRWMADIVIPRETDRYPYHTEDGWLIGHKVRLEPGRDGRSKTFVWERDLPDDARDKYGIANGVRAIVNSLTPGFYAGTFRNGTWHFTAMTREDEKTVELPDARPLLSLWRLPAIVATKPKVPLFVVEGEKVAKELVRLGFQATTGYAGMGKWEYRWGRHFADRRVVVVPDRDPKDAALEYGHRVLASCAYYQAAEVRLVMVPETELDPKGGDLCHWLSRDVPGRSALAPEDVAGRKAAVVGLVKRFQPYRIQAA